MNSRRSMMKSSQLLFAMASAERACPSSSAISPKISPGPIEIQDRVAAIRRGNADLHRPRDDRIQAVAGISFGKQRGAPLQRGVLGVAAELLESLRLKVGKNRVLAQDRQFAARKIRELHPSFVEARQSNSRETGLQLFRNQHGSAFQPESAQAGRSGGKSQNTAANSGRSMAGWHGRPGPWVSQKASSI